MNKIDLSRVDLNLLTAFEALYQEQSVSRAAERLYLGQSAMSHTLGRLRKLFDDVLLERQGQQMRPTRKADELYLAIHDVLSVIRDRVLDQSAFTADIWEGAVRIGLNDYCELVYARALFERIQAQAPHAQLSFVTVNRSNAADLLKAGKLDMALGHWSEAMDELEVQDLYLEKHVCLFDNRVLQKSLPLSLQDYLDTPHALVTPEGELSGNVDNILARQGLSRKVALGCSRFISLLNLLKGNRLLSVVPETMSYIDDSEQPLHHCIPPVAVGDFAISLAWRKSDSAHPVLSWLKQLMHDIVLQERHRVIGQSEV
ncbi:hypothetical protein GZ77_21725 [Endozoicomonas montiporae]|uniref:HTH lysR-type domain-containing protein n=2 Tax=Endozoicomonas montiporae TaxID=1027273 RepID=A0A081N3L3_9GAMM|nr:LysR family transcriptional regulator [Endozoicomonas montiporae]AMO58345.1 transcriptional regulator, LysR family [Endozoicomonas montiporae CL-33]KEQ13036.1 hypothetical protein GZ77_21725 [Endozoicomonas montiporae]